MATATQHSPDDMALDQQQLAESAGDRAGSHWEAAWRLLEQEEYDEAAREAERVRFINRVLRELANEHNDE